MRFIGWQDNYLPFFQTVSFGRDNNFCFTIKDMH